ncbi:MAG: phospholipase A [Burkholderiaceae bacterium]
MSRSLRSTGRAVALLAAGAAASAAFGQDNACTRIDDDHERLLCYDHAAGRPRANRLPTTPPVPVPAPALLPALPDLEDPQSSAAADREREPQRPDQAGEMARAVRDVRRSLGTSLADRWELDSDYDRGRFALRPYKPVFVMLADYSTHPNQTPHSPNPANDVTTPLGIERTDMKFQISLKAKVAHRLFGDNGDLWIGYTQTSYWQLYNSHASRPFRETNYEPEAMLVFRTNYSLLGWQGRMAGLSLNHQSNGRGDPESRSWNRLIAQFGFEKDNWMVMLRPWWRIPESRDDDNNPDIANYVGRADLLVVRKSEGHELSLLARHSLRGGDRSHGSLQLDYAFPIFSYLKGYVQVFSGYGASLIDYNHRQTRIGIGISLVQWL